MIRKDVGVVVGRFVPLQVGHERMLRKACEANDVLICLIAREDYRVNERTKRNPFTVYETKSMINNLSLIGHRRCESIACSPIIDLIHPEGSTQIDKDVAWSRHVVSIILRNLIKFNIYPDVVNYYTGEQEHVDRLRYAFTQDATKSDMLLPDYGFIASKPNLIHNIGRDDVSATLVRNKLEQNDPTWKDYIREVNHGVVENGWNEWKQMLTSDGVCV